MDPLIQALEKLELQKDVYQRLLKLNMSTVYNVLLAAFVILVIYLLIKVFGIILEYEITPPSSPERSTFRQDSKNTSSNKKKNAVFLLKKRYYLSPRKMELACESNLEFSSPAHS